MFRCLFCAASRALTCRHGHALPVDVSGCSTSGGDCPNTHRKPRVMCQLEAAGCIPGQPVPLYGVHQQTDILRRRTAGR